RSTLFPYTTLFRPCFDSTAPYSDFWPSMRRPVGVKWVLLFFRWTKFFFPPSCQLSPPFHPHSSMSDLVSLGASWVFSFQPVLPPVCRPFFQLHDGSSGQAIDAVTGTRRLGFCVFPS